MLKLTEVNNRHFEKEAYLSGETYIFNYKEDLDSKIHRAKTDRDVSFKLLAKTHATDIRPGINVRVSAPDRIHLKEEDD